MQRNSKIGYAMKSSRQSANTVSMPLRRQSTTSLQTPTTLSRSFRHSKRNGYPIGQNRLFEWLRDNGYLGKHGERRNIPNQQYVEMGLFEIKKGVRSGNDGVLYETKTPKITVKGQSYFINKFLNR